MGGMAVWLVGFALGATLVEDAANMDLKNRPVSKESGLNIRRTRNPLLHISTSGSFPAVLMPIFTSEYFFVRIFRDLQDVHSFAPLHSTI